VKATLGEKKGKQEDNTDTLKISKEKRQGTSITMVQPKSENQPNE